MLWLLFFEVLFYIDFIWTLIEMKINIWNMNEIQFIYGIFKALNFNEPLWNLKIEKKETKQSNTALAKKKVEKTSKKEHKIECE